MEESKCKFVEMHPEKGNAEEKSNKLSYEQLEQVAHQLSEQARSLYNQLQKASLDNMFKRLDYLFKVVENKGSFTTEFVESCTEEIKEIMTVPEEDKDSQLESGDTTDK